MSEQQDFWGNKHKSEWVVFHDESECKDERFLYHGFLFVSRAEGRRILDRLFQPYDDVARYEKEVHFTDLRGNGMRDSAMARHWVNLCREEWLCSDSMKFYTLGVRLDNINQKLYEKYHEDKVYVRFYEVGLRGSQGWFGIKNEQITHLFYDQGKKDVERYNKSISNLGSGVKITPLHSDYLVSGKDISKFLQLTDVLLGTVRKSFTGISKGATGQQRCVEIFRDVMLRFNNTQTAYNAQSRYWKRFGMSFFPGSNDITPEEFMTKDLNYYRKTRGLFYCDRETYAQRESKKSQTSFGF